ncbi:hypothetical protein AB0F77_13590 [Streptomyces sp. NPDC026672]|uniref:hypothetical protein n=1 Tax=unclassified Streptomyces TaxID=2593676 RepID=UPI0033D8DCEB
MVTSEISQTGDLEALVAALTSGREMVVLAPNGTVNTGLVTGDQRQIVATSTDCAGTTEPIREGPVRAARVKTARKRFVPPPCFEDGLAALDSGIAVLVGEPGTGRETHALNLLAHGREEPVLVQVDGAVNFARWTPRPRGVHGYLVMEPPDPFALRSWDLSRLEAPLAEAGARLLIVLADAPGLAGTLEDHLGMPVLRHRPPDPRLVFTAHLSDGCSAEEACAQWLRTLGPGQLVELLPSALPPRHAAQAAETVLRLGIADGASGAEVLRALGEAEGPEIVARAQSDPVLFAHLLSVSVYGGLHRSVVTERAADLLRLIRPGGEQDSSTRSFPRQSVDAARQRPLSETLRVLGAHRVPCVGEADTDAVAFLWPSMGGAVLEALCRDHTNLLSLFHTWLAAPGYEEAQIERAGRAAAAMAVATDGRSLGLLRDLAMAPSLSAPEVAAWCLGTALRDQASARTAGDLLEEWSVSAEVPLRKAVAHACHSDRGGLKVDRALDLVYRLMETLSDDTADTSVAAAITAALVQRFVEGDSRGRSTVLCRMSDWQQSDGVPGLLTALTFPVMASTDLAWWSEQILADVELSANAVLLTGHALSEPTAYVSMRDVLLAWCCAADEVQQRDRALEELLGGLVAARQPGFLRWLLAVDRGPDTMPGKARAARSLATWRSKSPTSKTD